MLKALVVAADAMLFRLAPAADFDARIIALSEGANMEPSELMAKLTASGSKTLKLTWSKVDGAKGYDIYFGACGGKYSKVASVSAKDGRGYKFSKLKKNTGYKAYVKAWKKANGKKKTSGGKKA